MSTSTTTTTTTITEDKGQERKDTPAPSAKDRDADKPAAADAADAFTPTRSLLIRPHRLWSRSLEVIDVTAAIGLPADPAGELSEYRGQAAKAVKAARKGKDTGADAEHRCTALYTMTLDDRNRTHYVVRAGGRLDKVASSRTSAASSSTAAFPRRSSTDDERLGDEEKEAFATMEAHEIDEEEEDDETTAKDEHLAAAPAAASLRDQPATEQGAILAEWKTTVHALGTTTVTFPPGHDPHCPDEPSRIAINPLEGGGAAAISSKTDSFAHDGAYYTWQLSSSCGANSGWLVRHAAPVQARKKGKGKGERIVGDEDGSPPVRLGRYRQRCGSWEYGAVLLVDETQVDLLLATVTACAAFKRDRQRQIAVSVACGMV